MRRWHILRWLTVAAACAPAACSTKEGPGLKVTVDLAAFTGMVETMQVVIGADPDGFKPYAGPNVENVGVMTEDFDGDGRTLELILTFVQPDATESFRVETGNQAPLTMSAQAMAFNKDDMIASAMGEPKSLSPGGGSEIPLSLTAVGMNPINAHTRTQDLGTATPDVAIQGAQPTASIAALAVCDVDGDMNEDVIIGSPGDVSKNLGATGAVTIVWGGWGMGTVVDLAQPDQPNAETHFYGAESAAQLGASVACVDLDGDSYDDIIIGSPGADSGRGRIYVVFGQPSFKSSRPVDLMMSSTTGAEIVWTTKTDGAALGKTLFAVTRRAGIAPYILAAAPGAKVTHLFAGVRPGANGPQQLDADAADHPTFTGIAAAALAAGDLDGNATSSKKLDVALADPTYRDVSDAAMGRGRVYLFADVDPAATTPIDVAMAQPTVTGTAANSHLGAAVLIADTSGQGDDLYIGAPFDDDTGVVYLFPNNPNIFLPPTLTIDMTTAKIAGYDTGGFYGAALASTLAGSPNGTALRLVVGAPNVSRPGRTGVGAAYLYKTNSDRLFRIYDQIYGKAAGDALGTTVAGGQLNLGTDSIGDLVAAAPNAAGSVSGTGVVYLRFGQK